MKRRTQDHRKRGDPLAIAEKNQAKLYEYGAHPVIAENMKAIPDKRG